MPLPDRFRLRTASRASLLLTALLLALSGPAFAARLATLSGDVESGRGEPPVWQPARAGDALAPGDRVRTGADGRAEVVLGRATIRLYPNSLLRVPESGDEDSVSLDEGSSLFDVLKGEHPYEVHTPEVVVSVKGTRFSVALSGGEAAVAVFRGVVGVRSLALSAAREVLVREGFVASGAERLDLRVLELEDPWEAFSRDVLPPPPLPETALRDTASDALAAARAEALETARPAVVERAVERHPELRARMGRVQRRAGEAGDRDRGRPEAVGPDGPSRDAVADAPASLGNTLEERMVETWLNGGNAAPSGGSIDVTFVGGSGVSGDGYVTIEELVSGQSWSLDKDLVEQVIEGEQTFPTLLVDLLTTHGIEEEQFARQLLMLFE